MPNLNVEFNMITLGLAIRAKRTQLTWRIEDLAEKADLSRRTIMRMEKGDANVTLSNLLTVLDLLGLSLKIVDIAALLGSSNKKLKTKLTEEDVGMNRTQTLDIYIGKNTKVGTLSLPVGTETEFSFRYEERWKQVASLFPRTYPLMTARLLAALKTTSEIYCQKETLSGSYAKARQFLETIRSA